MKVNLVTGFQHREGSPSFPPWYTLQDIQIKILRNGVGVQCNG